MSTATVEPVLRAIGRTSDAYRKVFVAGRLAPALSRAHPVRHRGFDLDLTVVAVTREADDVVSLTLAAPDGSRLPRWTPGAHVDVVLPSGRQRQYSLCGDPRSWKTYRIAVRRIEGGGASAEIHERLRVGDGLRVRGPRNAFPLIAAESYLFVAGGIGITPILPMVRAADRAGADWRLAYLGRSRATMPFLGELPARPDRVDVHTDDDRGGRAELAAVLGRSAPGAAVYVCGPTPVMAAARELLPGLNPTASLHLERFSAPPVTGGRPFSLRLARTGATVDVAADDSALAAIRRTLPGVAYSCQQGFCGSCKAGVLAGEVAHRDSLLLDRERADSMLICVSRSAGNSLVLDL